ncbi:hypothetical protein [Streptosporangium sp. NPDC002524]|uniref:hypothetical protein n=1 Tax=Streptosporangium sp. NPDC002524 TaxID=3154537 RepID=UPI003316AD1D
MSHQTMITGRSRTLPAPAGILLTPAGRARPFPSEARGRRATPEAGPVRGRLVSQW